MTLVATLCIDRLVGCDCVEPRTKFSTFVELINPQVDTQKGRLKNVFSKLRIRQESLEKGEDFSLVTLHQELKNLPIATQTIRRNQRFIRLQGNCGGLKQIFVFELPQHGDSLHSFRKLRLPPKRILGF